MERYEKAEERMDALQQLREERQDEADRIGAFMFTLHEMETTAQNFDPKLWLVSVDRATVHSDGRITTRFTSGVEIDS